jgi:CBS domain-containing protein
MENIENQKRGMEIGYLLSTLKERKPPIVLEHSTIQDVIHAMIQFDHSRIVYVQDELGKLSGTISLGTLAKHVFSRSHEPRIHARLLLSMITAETAKDIMQKRPVSAFKNEEVGNVLKRMIESNVKEIPILDEDRRVIGDITMLDLLKFLLTTVGESEGEGEGS